MKNLVHTNVEINEGEHLRFAGMDTVALANKYATPLFLVDENRIREKMNEYKSAMKKYFGGNSMPIFASKALSFKEIYRIAASEGIGTDIVSPGELYTVASTNFPMEKGFFHGNNKTDADIAFAMDKKVGYFVVDSIEELDAVDMIAKEKGIKQNILLRITPGIDPHTHKKISTGGVDSKFGSAIETGLAKKITSLALTKENINLVGFHCHVGSQIFDIEPFALVFEIMTKYIADIRDELNFTAKILNIGGGFGVRYVESDPTISITKNIEDLSKILNEKLKEYSLPHIDILMEPGRSIVADAGLTLYTVGSVKEIEGFKNYVSIDGGMTDNPRYALYQSAYTVVNATNPSKEADFVCTIGGRCCESGDLIQEDVKISKPSRGDTLAVLVTGAYNYSMASNYNRICRPAIVMIKDSVDRLVVKRETFEDLVKCDI